MKISSHFSLDELMNSPEAREYYNLLRKHFSNPDKSDTRRFYRVSEMGGNGTCCIHSWTVAAESAEDAIQQSIDHNFAYGELDHNFAYGELLDGITLVARLESE